MNFGICLLIQLFVQSSYSETDTHVHVYIPPEQPGGKVVFVEKGMVTHFTFLMTYLCNSLPANIRTHILNLPEPWCHMCLLSSCVSIQSSVFFSSYKGSRHERKVQFFLTLFKRPLPPPPLFVWTSCGEFFKKRFWALKMVVILFNKGPPPKSSKCAFVFGEGGAGSENLI